MKFLKFIMSIASGYSGSEISHWFEKCKLTFFIAFSFYFLLAAAATSLIVITLTDNYSALISSTSGWISYRPKADSNEWWIIPNPRVVDSENNKSHKDFNRFAQKYNILEFNPSCAKQINLNLLDGRLYINILEASASCVLRDRDIRDNFLFEDEQGATS